MHALTVNGSLKNRKAKVFPAPIQTIVKPSSKQFLPLRTITAAIPSWKLGGKPPRKQDKKCKP
jgi:hypothetical protein